MNKKNKRKKINNLNFFECKEILEKLAGHEQSEYYKQVLTRFQSLLPKQQQHKNHSKD